MCFPRVPLRLVQEESWQSWIKRHSELKVVRAYALEQREQLGQRAACKRAHAHDYLARAEHAALLAHEQENLQAASRWAQSHATS